MNPSWPTTEHIRFAWIEAGFHRIDNLGKTRQGVSKQASAEFDAWLADERAKAWEEAADEISQQGTVQIPDNPYRTGEA